MDEENKGFAIPSKRPMFDEGDVSIEARPLPQSDLFMVFANDEGNKAVILTPIESVGEDVLERHGRSELEGYAKTLFDGGDDPMDLQVGTMFEGDTAEADANAEAMRLDEEFNPGAEASDEELARAVDDAKSGAGAPESFPEDMEAGEDVGDTELDSGAEIDEEEEAAPEIGGEDEPMLEQLGVSKKKRPVT